MRARLIKIGKPISGVYEDNNESYTTRQYIFELENNNSKKVHVNVSEKNKNVKAYEVLKKGDWIEGFSLLPGSPDVINPRCKFTVIPAKTKGGSPLF